MKKNPAFWNGESRYGVIHHPGSNQIPGNNRCLVVFVHGVFGDCRSTWQRMPDWIIKRAEVDINVISFSYPSGVMQRCSIPQAADDLRAWLETEFRDYHHIIFVTHSTGGLVVKQLLYTAAEMLRQDIDNNRVDYSLSRYLWLRTRRIINIAVPHRGGSSFSSFVAKWSYKLLYPLMLPMLHLVRFLSQGNVDWGKNEIIPALRWNNPWLLELESKFTKQQRYAKDTDLLFPRVYDICAKADLSVPISTDINERKLYFRGTHSSIKIPRRINAPIVSIVAKMVEPFARDIAPNIVVYSMLRIVIVNQSTGIHGLIKTTLCEIGHDQDLPVPTLASSSSGSQSEVVDRIVELLQTTAEGPRQLVVTGAAGVGKSMVTRMIAWQLGHNFLANPEGGNPIPLLIPLQQITLDEINESYYSWETMWGWWLKWGKSIYKEPDCNQTWLEELFANKPVTIILDGMDDFLHNHPDVGFAAIVKMLREAMKNYPDNPNLSIIIGIRSTIHGLERLVNDNKNIFEVLRLSTVQAKQIYPNCANWIDTIEDKNLLDFILTPLILSNYEPDPSCNAVGKPMTQYSLLCQTIRTILSRSHLIGYQFTPQTAIELSHLGKAMMLIAWLFYYKSRGEFSIENLRREALQHKKQWQRFLADKKNNDENFYYETLAAESEEIELGFHLVADPNICNALLQRSVFVPTGPGMVRFAHRQWQEFLLGQYLSLCIRSHHFSELGVAAFHSRIYKTAGEAFGARIITENCAIQLLDAWEQSHNTFITGNVIALLSWTHIAVEPKAIQRLLDEILNVGQLSRVILIGGLAYRVLINHPGDMSLNDIKRALFPQIKAFANIATAPADDPIVSSLSWCYQKAFAERLGTEQPVTSWPGLDIEEHHTLKALPVICSMQDNRYILDERSKSLQLAFLIPIMEAYNDHNLVIRAVHYLYYLVIAQKYGVHALILSQELPRILSSGGEFEKVVASFNSVPEILTLFLRCQRIHEML